MSTTTTDSIEQTARAAREASRVVAALDADTKNRVLRTLADGIESNADAILAANKADMDAALEAGVDEPKRRRLALTQDSIKQLAEGLRQIASMDDPVGQVSRAWDVPSGLKVERVRTPLGVIAMIYEARPGVTVDAFALCFKAGNACLLKGGREATTSNQALAALAHAALRQHGAPEAALSLITSSDRDEMRRMLTLSDDIDLVIPRGGERLIRFVHEHSRIPTVQHFEGVCHIFVDASADLAKAVEIVATAKTSNPATCNTVECVLVHTSGAERFVPTLVEKCAAMGVEIRGDERFCAHAGEHGGASKPASEDDFGTEFLDLILAAGRRFDRRGDRAHRRHGSDHTESILTQRRRERRAVPPRGHQLVRDGERLDPVQRRVPAGARRRDRDLDQQGPLVRPDGPRRPHHRTVRRDGRGPGR
jgi:glutamate-5-semialdehyde dehydrogenase